MGYTEHPGCVLADSDTPLTYVSVWPVRILLSPNTVTKLLGAALVLIDSILRPTHAYSQSQPPYTQDSVREYKG
jgi:hypothetical protein